jgi:hypothetical protein
MDWETKSREYLKTQPAFKKVVDNLEKAIDESLYHKVLKEAKDDKGVGGQLSDMYIDLGRRLSRLYVGGNNFQGSC